jgi:hypothetical protein
MSRPDFSKTKNALAARDQAPSSNSAQRRGLEFLTFGMNAPNGIRIRLRAVSASVDQYPWRFGGILSGHHAERGRSEYFWTPSLVPPTGQRAEGKKFALHRCPRKGSTLRRPLIPRGQKIARQAEDTTTGRCHKVTTVLPCRKVTAHPPTPRWAVPLIMCRGFALQIAVSTFQLRVLLDCLFADLLAPGHQGILRIVDRLSHRTDLLCPLDLLRRFQGQCAKGCEVRPDQGLPPVSGALPSGYGAPPLGLTPPRSEPSLRRV